MLRFIAAALALAAVAGPVAADEPVQVMVLGSWHFGNPGQDVVNKESEDVRTEPRQRELEAIAEALAEFRPTKIMVERVAKSPDLIDDTYAGFTPELLRNWKDETAQLGYRLAHRLGHESVYAIDEQPSEGEPDYFPFGKVIGHAKAYDQMARLQAGMAEVEAQKEAFENKQGSTGLATLLLEENEPSPWKTGISGYYEMLTVGDTEEQPGAELNAYWYMRNAKIFGKLMTVAEPGDRILVIFGTSHAYWLRHFAEEVVGYENVDPRPYLSRAASSASCGLSQADQAWLDGALQAWDHALATAAGTDHPSNMQAIIFDEDCKLTSRTAMTGGEKVWIAEPHEGEVFLPDGNKLPAQVVSFAAPAPGGAFFVMAAPSIWQSAGVQSAELGLEQLLTAVMLHEAAHVLQFPTYGTRISRLVDLHDLPDDFSDDSIQERFETEEEFTSSIARETELLLAAAAAADRADAVRLAAEARLLAQVRHDRWFTGEAAYLREAEDVWLTFEGSAQWLGYQWLSDRGGGARSSEIAARGFGLRGSWWSQSQGFALFAALERLAGASWKQHAFGDGAKTAGEMLDEALSEAG